MSIPALKRLAMVLGILCVALLFGVGILFWNERPLYVQTLWADEQTVTFDEIRIQALQLKEPDAIAHALKYLLLRDPSGTRQRTGSSLDRVVERHRKAVVHDIIAHLRRTSGQDLGESPEPWIQKYAQK